VNQRSKERLDYFEDIADARIIGIDSVDAGKVTGKLIPAQLEWLDATLSAAPDSHQKIVMIHHPPFSTGLSRYDALSNLPLTAELADIVARHDKVSLLCGHVHRPYQAVWSGAACFIAGSPACQLSADPPYGHTPLHLVDEPYAYFLHGLDHQGTHVVSTRYVNLSDFQHD
jgi:3',5'-cyclic AMP phosphodiesterase CpdA